MGKRHKPEEIIGNPTMTAKFAELPIGSNRGIRFARWSLLTKRSLEKLRRSAECGRSLTTQS